MFGTQFVGVFKSATVSYAGNFLKPGITSHKLNSLYIQKREYYLNYDMTRE